jgi:quercetin dioxygenase-like cupin family protein
MKYFDWNQIPREQLNEKLSRRFVSGQKITIAQIFLKKGCVVPEHNHESEQFCFVMTGSLKFIFPGEEKIVSSDQLIDIPSNVRHRVEALEDTLAYDIFSPVRQDWLEGDDAYLRK